MRATGSVQTREALGFALSELLVAMAIFAILMGLVTQIIRRVHQDYSTQKQIMEAQDNALLAMDILVRLIRMAGNDPEGIITSPIIDPDPDGNGLLDSIRIRSDWNPADGDLDDPYEDIIFSVQKGVLLAQEPADASPLEFLDRIESIGFNYFDRNHNPIADPIANAGSICFVEMALQIQTPVSPAVVLQSSAGIRKRYYD